MSDNLERPILREEYDAMPFEPYNGLDHPTHRFANFIPVADDKDQHALRESVSAIGLVEPIVLYQGAILDGRHRYAACKKMGVEPKFIEFEGDEEAALQFVLAKNVARRNLTTMQKLRLREQLIPEIERLRSKATANKLANLEGQPVVVPAGRVDEEVGRMVGVSRETQRQYDRVVEAVEENPEDTFLADMLARAQRGEVSVKKAYTNISDELDKLAKQDAAKVDPTKQRNALVAAIGKAYNLLVDWDPSILTSDWEVAAQVDEMLDWLTLAAARVR